METKSKVIQIPDDMQHLHKLLEELQPWFPFSNTMAYLVRNSMRKVVTAKFYSDGWPHFTSIVCRVTNPNVVDIVIYSRCKESVLEILHNEHVLKSYEGIEKDSTLNFGELDDSLAQYLMKNMKSSDGRPIISDYQYVGTQLYLPMAMHSSVRDRTCPPGYFLGTLQPCHVDYICSYWKYSSSAKDIAITYGIAVSSFPTSAVFLTSNPTNPVAWFMCHAYGHMGHLFTIEEHRHKGLGTLVVKDLCCKLLEEGCTPECSSDNPEAIRIMKSIGMVEFQASRWLLYQQ